MVLAAAKAAHAVATNVTVEPASDNTGLYILIAAIVTVIGTLIVAFIAAATAGKRQKRSLASADRQHKGTLQAQTTGHKESLDAEDRRLVQRLKHERKLQDVKELTEFLDSVAVEYELARTAVRDFSAFKRGESTAQKVAKARSNAFQALLRADSAVNRVALRFDERHPVYVAYKKLIDLIRERQFFLGDIDGVLTPEQREKSTILGAATVDAFKTFGAAARVEIGAAVAAVD